MTPPILSDLSPYYQSYYPLLEGQNLVEALSAQRDWMSKLVSSVPKEKENFSYQPGKWTTRELLGHINDTERILAYRALRFLRKDPADLSLFDENEYVVNAKFNQIPASQIHEEWMTLRASTLFLTCLANDSELDFKGTVNGSPVTARSIFYFLYVHAKHHGIVLEKRYLS